MTRQSVMPPSTDFESLFHAAIIDLLVPSLSACPPQPENEKEAGPSSLRSWWAGVQDAKARDVAFFGQSILRSCSTSCFISSWNQEGNR